MLVSCPFLPDKKLAVVKTMTLQQKELVPSCTLSSHFRQHSLQVRRLLLTLLNFRRKRV
jgi:hypothetical protein